MTKETREYIDSLPYNMKKYELEKEKAFLKEYASPLPDFPSKKENDKIVDIEMEM